MVKYRDTENDNQELPKERILAETEHWPDDRVHVVLELNELAIHDVWKFDDAEIALDAYEYLGEENPEMSYTLTLGVESVEEAVKPLLIVFDWKIE